MKLTQMNLTSFEVIVPPGKYILGDPEFCFQNSYHWECIGDDCNWFVCNPIGTFLAPNSKTYHILGFEVARRNFHDQYYFDNKGNSYYTKSKILGLVPYELLNILYNKISLYEDQTFIDFKEETLCKNNHGDMFFGDIHINTNL